MINLLERFQYRGLSEFLPQWQDYDALAGQAINLISPESTIQVMSDGITEQGELRYIHDGQLHTLSNSHISIRFAS
jgi:BirA family biotin operon repressor/biotin-[acetyl-CoA-carboxylase] ligase